MADAAEGCGADSRSEVNVSEDRKTSSADAELDDLLEDALQDFDRPVQQSNHPDGGYHAEATASVADTPSESLANSTAAGSKCPDVPTTAEMQAMEDLFKSLISGDTSTLESQLGDLDLDADVPGAATGDADFAETLQRTLGNLAQSTQELQNKDLSQDELMKLMANTFGGAGDEAAGDDEFMPMMKGMMKSLLSKDVLYPSLKDISAKYPDWLQANRERLSQEEFDRYDRQHRMMASIVGEFEGEQATDSEDVKNRRFERILDVMQQMQELGQPPKELVGDAPSEFEMDEDGFPKMPLGGGLPSADQCCVM